MKTILDYIIKNMFKNRRYDVINASKIYENLQKLLYYSEKNVQKFLYNAFLTIK